MMYRRLLQPTSIICILPHINFEACVTGLDLQKYKFPVTTEQIDAIVALSKPENIQKLGGTSEKQCFQQFIEQVMIWLTWFERFIDIFTYIMECFKSWKLEKADRCLSELRLIQNDSKITVIQMKTTIQDTLKLLKPFNQLQRLCHIMNCIQSFKFVPAVTVTDSNDYQNFISDMKRSFPNNALTMNTKTQDEKLIPIENRRLVRWALAFEEYPCHLKIEYQKINSAHDRVLLSEMKASLLDRKVLRGEFVTQQGGHLAIVIDNQSQRATRTLRFQVQPSLLSSCHLFNGIFYICQRTYFPELNQMIKENELSTLLDRAFSFVDRLLDGSIILSEMTDLQTVFHDKNINVFEEVQKLVTSQIAPSNPSLASKTTTNSNASHDANIEQVYKWLQIYQYYSHLHIVMDCVQKFNLVSNEERDQSFDYLQKWALNRNCSLKDISENCSELYQSFRKLSNQHLQLIKTMLACSNVVQLMSKSNLYGPNGIRRFQTLRDNLTTQFQYQERNNTVLNSWIIAYSLCEPFIHQATSLEQFIDNLARLSNIEDSSMEHIRGECNHEEITCVRNT